MRSDPWAPYEPTEAAPWGVARVVHLHRRAGFAASWDEVRRDLADGPGPSVERLVSGKARAASEGVPDDFEATATLLADAAVAANDPPRLKAWWAYRMLGTPDPLGERLALLWHDHFATSNLKVNDLGATRRQAEALRRLGRAPFGDLLRALLSDPALLAWLDAPANRKGHPNENLARELMELFTLGVGHFSEADVKEAARALTGRGIAEGRAVDDPTRHDDGPKTILGRSDRFTPEALAALLLDQASTADRLAWRLSRLFFGEGAIDRAGLVALASRLRSGGLDVGRAVATILRSRAFFATENLRTRVLDPIGLVIGSVRALGLRDPSPSTLVLADWASRLGQDLFYPPNVGGWPGGRSWLSARAVVGRANFAASLVGGEGVGLPQPVEVLALASRAGRSDLVPFLADLLLGGPPDRAWLSRIERAAAPTSTPDGARRALALILASPEAQLG